MKPMLKAPATTGKRLKLEYDNLLSRFAFKFNLRRYNLALVAACLAAYSRASLAGSYTRPIFRLTCTLLRDTGMRSCGFGRIR